MLKERFVTAVVLVPPLVAALFLLPPIGIAVLFGALVAAAAWEWGALCGLKRGARLGYLVAVIALGAGLLAAGAAFSGVTYAVLAFATVWWLWMLYELRRDGGLFRSSRGRLAAGLMTLVPAWVALSLLHALDARPPFVLLFVLVLVAVADTAAYAAGHAFGRMKLAPSISPGKTIEGVLGGALAVMLLAYFCGKMFWRFDGFTLGIWVALATTAGLVSVIGDLSESKLKRLAGVKDSGTVLPGHGGILDRIDALTAAAPTFAFGWLVFFGARS
jgi:phosphatidate cytidylyltransferase